MKQRLTVLVTVLIMAAIIEVRAQDTFHVFPQFADGGFPDGTHYKSTLMIRNAFSSTAADCTFRLYGLSATMGAAVGPFSIFSVTVPQGHGWLHARSTAGQAFKSGYATLTCSSYVYANVLYSLYLPGPAGVGGIKAGEATVFSSDDEYVARIIADQTEGARVGVAIANNTDLQHTYRVSVNGADGVIIGNATFSIPARSASAKFVDEMVPAAAHQLVNVTIDTADFSLFSAIGLRFTGAVFTTIPAY